MNIAGLDLNLVPALDALLRRRNVTHAAADVGLSQPAMSRALSRLRDLYRDPLLVRTRGGYVLTPRAMAIQPLLASAVRDLRQVFDDRKFDPGAERRTVSLAASDVHTVLILPAVAARLALEAPGVELRAESYGPDVVQRLESGDLDFAFAQSGTALPPGAYSEIIGEDRLALVMRASHPAVGKEWSIADYGHYPHAAVALLGDGQSEIDAMLAAHGVSRRIAVVTPHFMAALALVAVTDMVTTVSAGLARRFAPTLGLVLHEPPFIQTNLQMTLVCTHVRNADPFLAWFRSLVREVVGEVFQEYDG